MARADPGRARGWPAPILGDETSISDGAALPTEAVPSAALSDPQATAVISTVTGEQKKSKAKPVDDSAMPTVVTNAYNPGPIDAQSTELTPSVQTELPVVGAEVEPRTEAHDIGRSSQTMELQTTNPRSELTSAPDESEMF